MDKIQTCIIENKSLMREGLKSLLNKSRFHVSIAFANVEEVKAVKDITFDLIILSVNKHIEEVSERIEQIKEKFPKVRIVVLAESLNESIITECFSVDSDGLLLKDIAAKPLIASLNLVMSGEKVFPTSMTAIILSGWNQWQSRGFHTKASCQNIAFSPRCLDVIQLLAEGCSNKIIARRLDIAESTVKVHLKAILRKLELGNRTQVAIWAINHGFMSALSQEGKIVN